MSRARRFTKQNVSLVLMHTSHFILHTSGFAPLLPFLGTSSSFHSVWAWLGHGHDIWKTTESQMLCFEFASWVESKPFFFPSPCPCSSPHSSPLSFTSYPLSLPITFFVVTLLSIHPSYIHSTPPNVPLNPSAYHRDKIGTTSRMCAHNFVCPSALG